MKQTLKKKLKGVSVVVITRNRHLDLVDCLNSLANQSEKPDEIIIIDNNSCDETKNKIFNFKNNNKLNIKYFLEKKVGYPNARNRGLLESGCQWVAFIDDDCVASFNWYKNIKLGIKKFGGAITIIGKSETFYKDNAFSIIEDIVDQNWKLNGMLGDKVINYEILDSKNIVYNNLWLEKNSIKFNESKSKAYFGACEDIDLGMSIFIKKGNCFYDQNILVAHKDSQNFSSFIKKYFHSKKSYFHNISSYYGPELTPGSSREERIKLKLTFKKHTKNLNFFKKSVILLILSLKVMVDSLSLFSKQKNQKKNIESNK